MAYIRLFASSSGKVILCIDHIVEYLGYKINRKEDKINDNIVSSLQWLKNKEYISYTIDLSSKVNHSKYFECIINHDNNIFEMEIVDKEKKKTEPYVSLYESEFDKIIKSDFIKKDWLLVVYLHIKKRINLSYQADTDPYFYSSLDTLKKDCCKQIKISTTSISRVISELVKNELLYEHITGSYIYDGKVERAVNVYTIDKDKMDHKLCDSIIKGLLKDYKDVEIEKFIKGNVTESTLEIETNQGYSLDIKSKIKNEIQDKQEDEMPFDTSGMNQTVTPYKVFGGVFDSIKEKDPISKMNEYDIIKSMGLDKKDKNKMSNDEFLRSLEKEMFDEEEEFEDMIS